MPEKMKLVEQLSGTGVRLDLEEMSFSDDGNWLAKKPINMYRRILALERMIELTTYCAAFLTREAQKILEDENIRPYNRF